MKKFLKKYRVLLILIVIAIVFFSSSLVITFDSTHYLGYVDIFEKVKPFSSWDIVRGPVFPFILYTCDLLFGKSSLGILLGMFIFYIVYCFAVYRLTNEIFKDNKHKNIWITLICIFCFFNPIVLGYFHTMLTEFVAITIATLTLLISWKWWNVDSTKSKILYSLYFIVFTTFSYFLKQSYICAVIIPMIISALYGVVRNHKIKNILYYFVTFTLTVVFLVISLVSWNKLLEYKNVNLNTGRDSSSLLSKQLLDSIDGYKVDEVSEYTKIKNDKYLSKNEKKEIKKELTINDSVYIISIYDNKKILEKDYLKLTEQEVPSGTDTVLEIISTFFRYPKVIIKTHAMNYCALSSVCVIKTSDGVVYHVSNELDILYLYENNVIPYKSFRNEEKNFYYPEERHETVKNYLVPRNQGIISKVITKTFVPTNIIYEFVILTVGIFLIGTIAVRIKKRKKLKAHNIYLLSTMMLSFSFITILLNDWVGSFIDRYAVVCFMPGLLGIVGAIVFIKGNFGKK